MPEYDAMLSLDDQRFLGIGVTLMHWHEHDNYYNAKLLRSFFGHSHDLCRVPLSRQIPRSPPAVTKLICPFGVEGEGGLFGTT